MAMELVLLSLLAGVTMTLVGMNGYSMVVHPNSNPAINRVFWQKVFVGTIVLGIILVILGVFEADYLFRPLMR